MQNTFRKTIVQLRQSIAHSLDKASQLGGRKMRSVFHHPFQSAKALRFFTPPPPTCLNNCSTEHTQPEPDSGAMRYRRLFWRLWRQWHADLHGQRDSKKWKVRSLCCAAVSQCRQNGLRDELPRWRDQAGRQSRLRDSSHMHGQANYQPTEQQLL